MAREGCRIAVIGAGFSGVMTAIHLLWRCEPGERVYLVERSGRIGPGLAYGTGHPGHLVNIRAENMSAFADEPDHFARWLERLDPEAQRRGGRADHRRHVRPPLGVSAAMCRSCCARRSPARTGRQSLSGGRPGHGDPLRRRVVPAGDGERAQLPDGCGRPGAGQFSAGQPPLPGFVGNPWSAAATAPLEPDRPVVVLGTGLTMIDVCLALIAQGFTGPIHAISRRGLLPLGHAPSAPWDESGPRRG